MTKVKHIVFIHKDFPYGGAETVTCGIANWLCRHGYVVTILAGRHHQKRYPNGFEPLFSVVSLPEGNVKYSPKVACAVRDFIKIHNVDVLVTYRELLYAKWLKRTTEVKLVYELHSSPFYECLDIKEKKQESRCTRILYSLGIDRLLTEFYKDKYRRVYGWADAYGVLCEGYKQEVMRILHIGNDNKIYVLPNFITIPDSVVTEKRKVILYVGRLSRRDKRVDRLFRIWKEAQMWLPDWCLKIVGSGKEERNLKAMTRQLHLKNIFFEGQTNNVKAYYNEASILCLTSSFEGWPMSVAEAQSDGVVPIMFDSFHGARELIRNEDEGILVRPFDENEYAEKLVELALNTKRLRSMSQTVLRKSKQYSVDVSGAAWLSMLENLTNN